MRFVRSLSLLLLGLALAGGAAQAAPITLDVEGTVV